MRLLRFDQPDAPTQRAGHRAPAGHGQGHRPAQGRPARSPTRRWSSPWPATPGSTPPRRRPGRARTASTGRRWSRPPPSRHAGAPCPTAATMPFRTDHPGPPGHRGPASGRSRSAAAEAPDAGAGAGSPTGRRAARARCAAPAPATRAATPTSACGPRADAPTPGCAQLPHGRPAAGPAARSAADLAVDRYELPNLRALNFVIDGLLGAGRGRPRPGPTPRPRAWASTCAPGPPTYRRSCSGGARMPSAAGRAGPWPDRRVSRGRETSSPRPAAPGPAAA